MRRLVPALMLPVLCLSVQAEQTGRISGKVLNKEGKPIPGAKVNLKRTDRAWTKDLTPDKNGNFLQVGLEPKEFEMTVSAPGFVDYKEIIKIPLADVLVKNITLLTPAEARAAAPAGGTQAAPDDPGAALDAEGRDAFNAAIPLYNEGKYEEALPHVDKAYKTLTDALTKLKDETAKAELAPELLKIERVLGICIAQAGAKKEEAEPYLLKALERNPKDERVIAGLIETSKAKADKAAEQKYTAMLEAIQGPNPDRDLQQGRRGLQRRQDQGSQDPLPEGPGSGSQVRRGPLPAGHGRVRREQPEGHQDPPREVHRARTRRQECRDRPRNAEGSLPEAHQVGICAKRTRAPIGALVLLASGNNQSSSRLMGQWSEPRTSAWMRASFTRSISDRLARNRSILQPTFRSRAPPRAVHQV